MINNSNNYVLLIANFTADIEEDNLLDLSHKNVYKSRKSSLYKQIANRKQYHYLSLEQYLQRWSKDGWWMKYLYSPYKIKDYFWSFLMSLTLKRGFNNAQNNLFNLIESTIGSYERDKYVLISDIGVPLSKLEKGLSLVKEYADIHPLWLCPILDNHNSNKIFWTRDTSKCSDDIIFDLGIYGYKRSSHDTRTINEAFEKFSFQQGLFKGFFSTIYFKKDDFWKRFNKNQYQSLRSKYKADSRFMDLYDKLVYKQATKEKALTLQAKLLIYFGLKMLNRIKKNELSLIKDA